MNNISKTGAGLIAVAIYGVIWVGQYFGISILEADATTLVQNIIGIVGLVSTYYGQFKRKDLVGGLVRK